MARPDRKLLRRIHRYTRRPPCFPGPRFRLNEYKGDFYAPTYEWVCPNCGSPFYDKVESTYWGLFYELKNDPEFKFELLATGYDYVVVCSICGTPYDVPGTAHACTRSPSRVKRILKI